MMVLVQVHDVGDGYNAWYGDDVLMVYDMYLCMYSMYDRQYVMMDSNGMY